MNNYDARFGGILRLFGSDGQQRLRRSHVCVIGIGGVGSWAVEALARTGVGELTLVDLDEVCISNVNRQLHAVTAQFGRHKVEVMTERIRAISPDCSVHPVVSLFTATTAEDILSTRYSAVLDAIDSPSIKALLIARCCQLGIPIVTTGGAGGRRDPTALRVEDLARTTHDGLLQATRKILRGEHGFSRREKKLGVPCVYSPKAQVFPARDGSICERPETGSPLRLDCRSGYGTATFVTGAFGFAAAAQVVKLIVESA